MADEREGFVARFKQRFSLRLHMSAILFGTTGLGVLTNKLMFLLGAHEMFLRYPVVALAAYGGFLGLVRVWLAVVVPGDREPDGRGARSRGNVDLTDLGSGSGRGGGSVFDDGGGRFSGGGATARWDGPGASFEGNAAAQLPPPLAQSDGLALPKVGSSSSSGWSFDLDGDAWPLLLVGAAIALILGAGIVVVMQAPSILAESAFQVALGGALARRARQLHADGWVTGLVKATWKPFAVLLLVAVLFSWGAWKINPAAQRITDLFGATPATAADDTGGKG